LWGRVDNTRRLREAEELCRIVDEDKFARPLVRHQSSIISPLRSRAAGLPHPQYLEPM
jgi:hypothetical protein